MDLWTYHRKKFIDKKGCRWHFMHHNRILGAKEHAVELYFRNDERTVFGVLRFDRGRSYPGLDTTARKIMYDAEFRATLLDDESRKVWRGR